jgi:hypothetical protein
MLWAIANYRAVQAAVLPSFRLALAAGRRFETTEEGNLPVTPSFKLRPMRTQKRSLPDTVNRRPIVS